MIVPSKTGTVRKTPTLEEIHKSLHGLNAIVNEISGAIIEINAFLKNPSSVGEAGAEKHPEQPGGKLQEIDRTIDVVRSGLESILRSERQIMQTLGCAEQQ